MQLNLQCAGVYTKLNKLKTNLTGKRNRFIPNCFLSFFFFSLNFLSLKTEDEIARVEQDIEALEKAIRDKDPAIKLAHTRLENRTYRPGMELVRDDVQYGLVDEVKQLEASQKALQDKCKQQK